MEEKEAMKNKVVRKLLMVGLSSSVVLTSTVGVTAASMDATTTDVVVENAAEDEVLTPVEGEEAVTEETSEEVAEEETTEETGEEVAEEETTEDTEDTEEVRGITGDHAITVWYVDPETNEGLGSENVVVKIKDGIWQLSAEDLNEIPDGWEIAGGQTYPSHPEGDTSETVYLVKKAAETSQ